jgi:hypothetical protein
MEITQNTQGLEIEGLNTAEFEILISDMENLSLFVSNGGCTILTDEQTAIVLQLINN